MAYRILIAEDSPTMRSLLASTIEDVTEAEIIESGTGFEALKLLPRHQFDLIITDINMPIMDGIDATSALRSDPALRDIAIFALTGDVSPVNQRRIGEAGVDGYLEKPVTAEALAAQIEVAVRRFRETEELYKKTQELSQTLENRKTVEKAKGIFMKRLSLDEPEAHRRLQQESQKRRISLADLAKKIIESEELLGG